MNLRWSWETPVPELDTSVFIIPRDFVKNGLDRYAVLNRIARSVIESCRGEHPEFVFTRDGKPVVSTTQDGRQRVAEQRSATRSSSNDPVPRGFDP